MRTLAATAALRRGGAATGDAMIFPPPAELDPFSVLVLYGEGEFAEAALAAKERLAKPPELDTSRLLDDGFDLEAWMSGQVAQRTMDALVVEYFEQEMGGRARTGPLGILRVPG